MFFRRQGSFGRRVPRVLAVFALLLAPHSLAQLGSDMYRVAIAAESQSGEHRSEGMKMGLAELIIRLTGRSDSIADPLIQETLEKADRYLQSYSYARKTGADDAPSVALNMQFDPELIQGLLRRAELPMWVSGRPTMLLWIAVNRGDESVLLTPEADPELSLFVEKEMSRRGVPIRWPRSSNDIELDAVQNLDSARIINASAAYPEETAFAATIKVSPQPDEEPIEGTSIGADEPTESIALDPESPEALAALAEAFDNGVWAGRCLFIHIDQAQQLRCGRGTKQEFLANGVDSLADVLTESFSVRIEGGQESSVKILIGGVSDFSAYARTLKHLRSNALVREVAVLAVSPDALELRLELQGGAEQFTESLQRARLLTEEPRLDPYGPLRYRLYASSNEESF